MTPDQDRCYPQDAYCYIYLLKEEDFSFMVFGEKEPVLT